MMIYIVLKIGCFIFGHDYKKCWVEIAPMVSSERDKCTICGGIK